MPYSAGVHPIAIGKSVQKTGLPYNNSLYPNCPLKHKLDAIKAMGTNAKKEALASMDDFEQRMVSLMLNPFVRFGVKKYKVADPLSKSVPSDQKAIELLEQLIEAGEFS